MRNEHSGELWKGVHHASTLHVRTTHKLIFIRVHKHTLMISKHAAKLFLNLNDQHKQSKNGRQAITYSIRYESLFQFIALMCLYYVQMHTMMYLLIWLFKLKPKHMTNKKLIRKPNYKIVSVFCLQLTLNDVNFQFVTFIWFCIRD